MQTFRRNIIPILLGTVLLLGPACRPPEGGGPAGVPTGAPVAYDPADDPLVNPPSLFEPAPVDPAVIAAGETLYRNMDGNPANLNPLFMTSTYEFYTAGVLFEGIFGFDAEFNWMLNPNTVESFEESDDHLVYTVRMKPGLTWHDGHPYTAHDVCFSWAQILDERVPCPSQRPGTDKIKDCRVLNEQTFQLEFVEALPTNIWNANFSIIPKHLYEKDKENNPDLKSGEYYNNLNRAPVGSGPYKFVRWLENDKIELERWDDFYGEKPHFKRMIFRIIPDSNILLLTFNKAEVDEFRMTSKQFATQTGPDSDFAKVGYKIMSPAWQFAYIVWNMDGSNPFFHDVRVRRAMTQACDIPRIIRDLTYNLTQPSYGIFHPDAQWFNPQVRLLEYDLDEAARLLDEAGWLIDEERGGWRHKVIDGRPVKFEFLFQIPQGSSIGRDLAAIFQEDLRSIGVDMKTQLIEWATFSERNRKHEFQASTAAWGTGVDPDTLWNIWHSDQYDPEGRFGRNYGGFKNDRVDELFALARREFDIEKRRDHYREIQKIIYDEQPYTFLYARSTLWAMAKRVRGITTSPRGVFNFTPAEAVWWVHRDQQKYAPAGMP